MSDAPDSSAEKSPIQAIGETAEMVEAIKLHEEMARRNINNGWTLQERERLPIDAPGSRLAFVLLKNPNSKVKFNFKPSEITTELLVNPDNAKKTIITATNIAPSSSFAPGITIAKDTLRNNSESFFMFGGRETCIQLDPVKVVIAEFESDAPIFHANKDVSLYSPTENLIYDEFVSKLAILRTTVRKLLQQRGGPLIGDDLVDAYIAKTDPLDLFVVSANSILRSPSLKGEYPSTVRQALRTMKDTWSEKLKDQRYKTTTLEEVFS